MRSTDRRRLTDAYEHWTSRSSHPLSKMSKMG
jgi:hypothetical protein